MYVQLVFVLELVLKVFIKVLINFTSLTMFIHTCAIKSTYSNVSLDEGVCVIIIVAFLAGPAPFVAVTSISSVSPRLLTL